MINAYLVDTVYIARPTRDEWGEVTLLSLTEVRGRIDYKVRRVINFKGEEVTSEKSVLLGERDIHPDDFVRIDGPAGRDWPVLKIAKPKDFSWNIVEVYL
jgi:hypothetical protein